MYVNCVIKERKKILILSSQWKDIPAIGVIKKSHYNMIKFLKEAVHEGEEDSCDGCLHQSGWKEHLKLQNLDCFKLTTE